MDDILVVGAYAENPFVEDIAFHLNQIIDYSDIISLKSFLNTEFCPRFITDSEVEEYGHQLEGKTIIIVSSQIDQHTRDELAMRNFLIARAAKDNGAKKVILLEPDLYYSAQDRGPRADQGFTAFERDKNDYKKFDGQPWSSRLYANLLKESGVDQVVTVHNHSQSTQKIFTEIFPEGFYNLQPALVYANYLKDSDIINYDRLVLCAPDKGALPFVYSVRDALADDNVPVVILEKERIGEREVKIQIADKSELGFSDLENRDIVILDDMVRTGSTIRNGCELLHKAGPNKVIFMVTHFYSSREGRVNMNSPTIDEIVTTTTIPQILNRDVQGRLRSKLVVLRIARWIASYILSIIDRDAAPLEGPYYTEDMSSKNPRWKPGISND